ncbi:MAG: 50S ribosomal protein L35 [Christensenellales bacterium]|jgi:large subunit ribosomal protein L35
MPKMKSNRGAVKRFRVTKNGKVKYRKMNRNHILTKKNTKRQRHLRAGGILASNKEARTIRTLIQQ